MAFAKASKTVPVGLSNVGFRLLIKTILIHIPNDLRDVRIVWDSITFSIPIITIALIFSKNVYNPVDIL